MKQNSITSLIIVGVFAAILSLVASKYLFGGSTAQQSAVVAPVITSNFPAPNISYFNVSSIDPTQLIIIGKSTNANPFAGSNN